jgi:predicted Fe-Mo cluster-binding NifX family protein
MPKIAFPTDDGVTISAHLGRARVFVVAEYEGDGEVRFEERAKPQHGQHQHGAPAAGGIRLHDEGHGHGHEPHAHSGPGGMLSPLADCNVLIAGGMGQPAYDSAERLGLKVVLTGQKRIAEAVEAYRTGGLTSDMRRVHAH